MPNIKVQLLITFPIEWLFWKFKNTANKTVVAESLFTIVTIENDLQHGHFQGIFANFYESLWETV